MDHEFRVIAPRLKLDDQLEDIKRAVLRERGTPSQLRFDRGAFVQFASRLEGNWGSLYEGLPRFYQDLLDGRWSADDQQRVPGSLLGDFGEFIAAAVFCRREAPNSDIARVIRASGLPRPDFLVCERGSGRITAVESKASSENARRVQRGVGSLWTNARFQFNCCSTARGRREDGKDQIGSQVVLLQRSGGSFPVGASTAQFGDARVIANRSAVVTPFFIDGRLRPDVLFPVQRLSQPLICNHRCTECLITPGRPGMILCPIFTNDDSLVKPVWPEGMDGRAFFSAYRLIEKSLWTRSAVLFSSGWDRMLNVLEGSAWSEHDPERVLLTLLDILAAAREAGFAEASLDLLEPLLRALGNRRNNVMALTLTLQSLDLRHEGAAAGMPDVEGGVARRPVEVTRRQVEPESPEHWASSFVAAESERTRVEATPRFHKIEPAVPWEMVSELLDRDPDHQVASVVPSERGQPVSMLRPPINEGDVVQLRLAAESNDDLEDVIASLSSAFAVRDESAEQRQSTYAQLRTQAGEARVEVDGEVVFRVRRMGASQRGEGTFEPLADGDGMAIVSYRPTTRRAR